MKPVKAAELRSTPEIALVRNRAISAALPSPTPRPAALPPPTPRPAALPLPTPRPAALPLPPARQGRLPGVRVVQRQIGQIFSSPDFDASRRSKEFLRFIVEEALGGRGDDLTQAAIATRVFGRKDDFDAVVDPIVRIQAGRLRRSLERYYLLSGRSDELRIELPRGAYVPVFHPRSTAEPAALPEERTAEAPAPVVLDDEWPILVIDAFEPIGATPEHTEAAIRLTEELVLELGRYRFVRALLQREMEHLQPSHRARVRFSLAGRLRVANGDRRVTARLVDRSTGEQLWGDEYQTAPQPDRWSGSLDDIARVIAARVGAEEGVVVQTLAAERRKRKPAAITPYGAVVLSYEFFLARDPQGLPTTLEALLRVVKSDPECGPAWTRLARVSLANYAFEITTLVTPIDDAITYALHGVRVDPVSRPARCILAAALLVKGELDAARDEMEEALRLSPDSLVYLEIIGYFLTLLGDGTRGPALIRNARERNPHSLPQGTMGLWFDHLRRGEVLLAYQRALEYRDPTFFWRAVMRASCLGLLGRTVEAGLEVTDLLQRKPDFEARGRRLIGHYIKLDGVMSQVVDGLARAGLKLA